MDSAQSIFDRFPRPPCADLLGWTLLESDAGQGTAKLAFEGRAEFRNPAGFVQGGMLAAMLDDAMGPAVLIMSAARSTPQRSISMSISSRPPDPAASLPMRA